MNDERHKEDTLTSTVLQEAVAQHALECHVGMRSSALYPAESSACKYLTSLRSIQYRPL
jgi:hypothetical protein